MNSRDIQDPLPAQLLTPREEEVLALIGTGKTNRQIAEELTVARSTVKWYVRQIYNKLSVNNREEAVGRARELGLLTEEDGAVRHNLSAAVTPFVGREDELAALAGLIADPQVRIITITGPGGIGKTRLGLEAAGREVRPQPLFRDGVFFVSLAPLETAEEITAALATALDFQFQDSGNEPEQLLNYLRNKQMLVVMDNFEHILDGRALLAKIIEEAAGITLLVTSRARLQMRGEQLFPLGGLETTQDDETSGETPASELFLHIARRTAPDFQLLEGDAEQVLRICRLVEGMPLGLELAASWAGLLPLSEIAAEIERSLDLLTVEYHDIPQRHRSMEAALDVSWRRLTSEQQRAFQELTVCRGGFTRTAALEVAGATLPLLVTLADKSWLTYDRQEDRYHIHELLRQYGAAKLSAKSAYKQDVRARHSTYFCGYLQEREADWYGPRQREAAAEIGDEVDNVQRAWRWAADQGDSVLLAQGLNSLCHFYDWKGRLKDGQENCRLAADGLSKRSIELNCGDAQRLAIWSRVLAWESHFAREATKKRELLVRSQRLLDRAAQSGQDTRSEQAFIFLEMSDTAGYRDFEEALRFGNLGLDLFQKLNNRWGEAKVLAMQGATHNFRGEYDLALDCLRSSLEISEQLDDTINIAESTQHLGIAAKHRGHFEEAESLQRQSLRLFQQLSNRFGERGCLVNLAFTLTDSGKFLAAQKVAQQALELDRELGQYPYPGTYNPFIKATIHLGRYAEAKFMANEVIEIARQRGLAAQYGFELFFLGNIALVEGDLVSAKRDFLESSAVLKEVKHIHQARPQANLYYVLRAQGYGGAARDYLLEALRSGNEYRSISPIMYCLPAAALIAVDDGNYARATELYSLARQFGHIKNSCWFADVAGNELDEVRASLPAEKAEAAEARGREMDVWETAEALLRELDGR
jgi:predicted ATPase/DNA-binding CsgD family transcriptional regulator